MVLETVGLISTESPLMSRGGIRTRSEYSYQQEKKLIMMHFREYKRLFMMLIPEVDQSYVGNTENWEGTFKQRALTFYSALFVSKSRSSRM